MLPRSLSVLGALVLLAGCDATAPERSSASIYTESRDGTVAMARAEKVDVCHVTEEGYALLSISANALRAHTDHGDGVPGGAVPGQPGAAFGDTCQIVDASPISCDTEAGIDPETGAETLTVTLDVLDPESYRAEIGSFTISGPGDTPNAFVGRTLTDTGDPDFLIASYAVTFSSVDGPIDVTVGVRPFNPSGPFDPGVTCGPYAVGEPIVVG